METQTAVKKPAKKKKEKNLFFAALIIGALLAGASHFCSTVDFLYVLFPWLYLPCFVYAERKWSGKLQCFLWFAAWEVSFIVRFWGFLNSFSWLVSIGLIFLVAILYTIPFILDRIANESEKTPKWIAVLMFPFAFATLEYLFEFAHFGSLFSFALTQFDNKPILQLASVIGGKGIVFLMTLFTSAIIYFRYSKKGIALCLAALFLVQFGGTAEYILKTDSIDKAQTYHIGWCAPTISSDSFFDEDYDGELSYNLDRLEEAIKKAKAKDITLLCFPEECFYLSGNVHDVFILMAKDLAKEYEINLLLSVETEVDKSKEDVGINHCIMIDSEGEVRDDYLKTILIPVVEEPYYIAGNGVIPDVNLTIEGAHVKMAYTICFDGDFETYISTMKDDVSLLVDVSWDWDEIDELHYRIIGLRAVENGITVAKPTTNGYTTVTDYAGRVWSKTHTTETGYDEVQVLTIPHATSATVYHKLAKVFDIFFAVGLIFLLFCLGVMKREKTTSKAPIVRFGEFEFLKAVAIVGLPLVHIMEEAMEADMASPGLLKFGQAIIGLCAFGPSVFMICMGFGIGGGKTSADAIRRTGIQFLLIGALLNIFRWLIPGIIQWIVLGTDLIDDVNFCLQSDIYYFVGTFFVFYSFLKKYKVSSARLLLTAIILLTVNNALTPLMQQYVTNSVAASLIGNLIYVDETSCFPLFSWAIFPTVGIIFGEVLKKNTDEFRETFMRRMLDFSVVFLGAFTFFLWKYDFNLVNVFVSPANEYITDLPNVIALIALACVAIGLAYYLCKLIGGTKFMAFVLKISTFIIPFYLLQWVIIAWMFYATNIFQMDKGSFGLMAYAISAFLVTALCIYVSTQHGMKIMKIITKCTSFKKKKKKVVKKDEK